MKRIVLKSNIVYAEQRERAKCSELDKEYFGTLTEKEQATYRISYEPMGNQKYQLVATYESEVDEKLVDRIEEWKEK